MHWLRMSKVYTGAALLAFLCCLSFTMAHGWDDEASILKWSPTWLSNFQYSAPIGIRSRGYLFKRLTGEYPYGLKWSPNFLMGPFGGSAGRVQPTRPTKTEFTGPRERKVLGWYAGPGSRYQMYSKDDSSEEDDDYLSK